MSRFLFVVPPLHGHVNPTIAVARQLTARGHQVAWAGLAGFVRPLVGPQATVFDCAGPELGPGGAHRPPEVRGPAALKFLWERFLVPLSEAMAPGVRAAVDRFAPDVVITDQQTVIGALVAEEYRLPWVTSATTSAEFIDPLASIPKVDGWLRELLGGLRHRIGASIDPDIEVDARFSPHLVLAFTTAELAGPAEHRTENVAFVGPAVADRPSTEDFPWERLDGELPTVLITLGTANVDVGARFLTECAAALGPLADRLRAVLVDPAGTLETVPDNVIVRGRVPQLALLRRVDAVLCHGGHNTVCETLDNGLPLVIAPIRDDQPIVAKQVVDAGAGVRLRFTKATAGHISAALLAVLDDPAYRQAAHRIRESFRAAGGAAAAALRLEELIRRTAPAASGRTPT